MRFLIASDLAFAVTLPCPRPAQGRSLTKFAAEMGRIFLSAALILAAWLSPVLNAAGGLDTTFGSNGKVQAGYVTGADESSDCVAQQSDGKLVVAGTYYRSNDVGNYSPEIMVARFQPNGTIDRSFNGTGSVITPLTYSFEVVSVAIQQDGKIVAAVSGASNRVALVRYHSTGSLDDSFGTGGIMLATSSFSGTSDTVSEMILQTDGKILVVGTTMVTNKGQRPFLARYHSDGSLDSSFGSSGVAITAFATSSMTGWGVCQQTDGKIAITGHYHTDPTHSSAYIARYTANGLLDNSFGVYGIAAATVDARTDAVSIKQQSSGKLVVAGRSYNATGQNVVLLMMRFWGNGVLDGSFGTAGKTKISSLPDLVGYASDLVVQADDRLLFGAGRYPASGNGSPSTFIVRCTADGVHEMSASSGSPEGPSAGLIVQADGKIVSVSNHSKNIRVQRFLSSGNSDNSFGSSGTVSTDLQATYDNFAGGIAVQADGKIWMTGSHFNGKNDEAFLVRSWAEGGMGWIGEEGYSTEYMSVVKYLGSNSHGNAMAMQRDGKVLMAGDIEVYNTRQSAFMLRRYLPSGAGDNSGFSNGNMVITDFGTGNDKATAMAVQADDRIVLAGQVWNGSAYRVGLVRYNLNGTLDANFGSQGKMTTAVVTGNNYATSVVVQTDGQILVAGYGDKAGGGFCTWVMRCNADGSLDTSFGTEGKTIITFATSGNERANGMTLQSDGKILVVGTALIAGSYDFTLARFTPEGVLDSSFGTGGKVTTPVGSWDDAAKSVVEVTGKILVAGSSNAGAGFNVALVRYLANGSIDPSFGTSGVVLTDINSTQDATAGMVVQSGGRVVVAASATSALKTDPYFLRYINPLPPSVTTLPATEVYATAARMRGTVNANSLATTLRFEYGLTTSYGSTENITLLPNSSGSLLPITFKATGLTPSTTYHYRLAATNSEGTTNGLDSTLTTEALSANADLQGITLSDGVTIPGFDSAITEYDFEISDLVIRLTILPVRAQPYATVTVNGTPDAGDGRLVTMNAGTNTIVVGVTSEDGLHTKTYTLNITRPISANADLSSLTVSSATLSPAFSAAQKTYTGSVSTFSAQVVVTAQPLQGNSTLTINGAGAVNGIANVDLVYGPNIITVEVTSEDTAVTSVYTLTITRPVPAPEIKLTGPTNMEILDAGSFAFGNVGIKGGQRTVTFTIANIGTADLTGVTASIDGPQAALFSFILQPANATIAPEGYRAVTVRYSPAALGPHGAALHIASDDEDESPFDILLSGAGVQPAKLALTTNSPFAVADHSATLEGRLNPLSTEPLMSFEYGTSSALGNTVTATPQVAYGSDDTIIRANLQGLAAHTKYFYRLRAVGSLGVSLGSVVNFTTDNNAPTANSDTFTVMPGAKVPLDILFNDTDPDTDNLSLVSFTKLNPTAAGKLAKVGNTVVFTASPTFLLSSTATATFSYAIKDGYGGTSSSSTVTLNAGTCILNPIEKIDLLSAQDSYDIDVFVTGDTDGLWSVAQAPKWVTVTPSVGKGDDKVTVRYTANAAADPRTGIITIGGQNHTVTQAGVTKPTLSIASVPAAIVGNPYTLTIVTTGAPVTYKVTNMPAGLKMDNATGIISGIPTKGIPYQVTVSAANAAGPFAADIEGKAAATVTFEINVQSIPVGALGTFNGFIERHADLNGNLGSRFEITTTGLGAYSGKIISGTTALAIKGKMKTFPEDADHPQISLTIARKSLPNNPFELTLNLNAADHNLDGTFADQVTATAIVRAWRNTWSSSNKATAYVPQHTFFMELADTSPTLPQGYGYGSFAAKETTGAVKVAGKLADGSAYTSATFVGKQGQVLLYQSLYGNKGSFGGILTVHAAPLSADNTIDVDIDRNHTLSWLKPAPADPAKSTDTVYKNGFGPLVIIAEGGAYTQPAKGKVIMNLKNNTAANAQLAFKPGSLDADFTLDLEILNPSLTGLTSKTRIPIPNNELYKVNLSTLTAASGFFSGDFTYTATPVAKNRKVPFSGIIVTHMGVTRGYGYSLAPEFPDETGETVKNTPKNSGRVTLDAVITDDE